MWLQVPVLEKASDTAEALRIGKASIEAISDIRSLGTRPGNDIQMNSSHTIWGATCERQSGHWDRMMELMESYQIHSFRFLGTDEIRNLTGSDALIDGVIDTASALVHPGHLVRALRRAGPGARRANLREDGDDPTSAFEPAWRRDRAGHRHRAQGRAGRSTGGRWRFPELRRGPSW